MTYSEKYAYNYAIKALNWAIMLTLLSSFSRFVAKKFKNKTRTKANPLLASTQEYLDNMEYEISYRELKKYLKRQSSSQPIFLQLAILLSSIGNFLAYLVYGAVPAILSSLGIISLFTSIIWLVLLSVIAGIIMIKLNCPSEVKPLIKAQIKRRSCSFFRKFCLQATCVYNLYSFGFKCFVGFLLFFSIFFPYLTTSSCMAYYTPEYGSSFDAYTISTSLSRLFTMEKKCTASSICHFYTTLPQDPSTGIILNIHTGSNIDQIQIIHKKENSSEYLQHNKSYRSYYLDIEWKARRYIHSIYIDNLEPNTLYGVQIYAKGNILGDAKFKTLPSEKMEADISIVTGGDAGGTKKSVQFISHITKYNPDIVIIGGDIVYDNGNINCYYCWDYYLEQFSLLNKRLERLVPLVLAVGNHDVGINSYQFINVAKEQNLLFLFFPQHLKTTENGQEIPDPNERKSYFYHRFGNTLHVTLDSGYLTQYSGEQTEWLAEVSQRFKHAAKIATYHTPIFPACFFNPLKRGMDRRFSSWIPIFEKYHFMGVFENHVHLFKRTFPLKLISENKSPGVVYFGDGAWGVGVNECFTEDPNPNITGIFAKLDNINHLWIMTIGSKDINYKAINLKGEIIDQYYQKISDYNHSVYSLKSLEKSTKNNTIDF